MKITIEYLKSINKRMKENASERALALTELMEMDLEMNYGLLMYRSYLIGKCHFWNFSDTKQVSSLRRASDYFDAVFDIAYENKVGVKNSRYWFKRAHTKWELLKHMPNSERKEKQKAYVRWKVEAALEKFPTNSSMQWLMAEITK